MQVDADNPTPIFQQIVSGIAAAVAAGVYRPGELVPSVRHQAVAIRVNPNTVQRAYEQLERHGLLRPRRGSGMEVADGAADIAAQLVADAVRDTFGRGIGAGRAARLSRTAIDGIYRKAWNGDPT